MIRRLFNTMLGSMEDRYNYDVGYMREILTVDLPAFLKFLGFQTMSSHRGNLPAEVLSAARLRAILWEDCGPCTQLIVDMALEAGVRAETITAILNADLAALSEETALVVRFTECVLAHDPDADDLRDRITAQWGQEGLVALGFGISSCRVYPSLKYTMGYGKACSRITVNDSTVTPGRPAALAGAAHG